MWSALSELLNPEKKDIFGLDEQGHLWAGNIVIGDGDEYEQEPGLWRMMIKLSVMSSKAGSTSLPPVHRAEVGFTHSSRYASGECSVQAKGDASTSCKLILDWHRRTT